MSRHLLNVLCLILHFSMIGNKYSLYRKNAGTAIDIIDTHYNIITVGYCV